MINQRPLPPAQQQQQLDWQLPPFQPAFLHEVPHNDVVQELKEKRALGAQPTHVGSADSTPAIKLISLIRPVSIKSY